MARALLTRSFHFFQRSNIAETYPHLADMPGFEEPGIPEAWLCAAADGNMAQVKAAFDAQRFDLDGFVPQSLEKVAAAAPKAKKPAAEKAAKKPAAKKAAKTSVNDKSEPKKRGRPKKIVTESKPLPKKAKATKPKKTMGSLGADPYGVVRKPAPPISDGGRRSGRNGTPGPARHRPDIDTDAYFVSPSSLPA